MQACKALQHLQQEPDCSVWPVPVTRLSSSPCCAPGVETIHLDGKCLVLDDPLAHNAAALQPALQPFLRVDGFWVWKPGCGPQAISEWER